MENISLKKVLAKLLSTKMVIESGTSGIWTYRKWSDGTAECWGRAVKTLSHYTTSNGFYGYYTDFAFPSDLFIAGSTPTHTYTATVGSGFGIAAGGQSTTNTNMRVYALSSASGSQSCTFDIVAKGRWKQEYIISFILDFIIELKSQPILLNPLLLAYTHMLQGITQLADRNNIYNKFKTSSEVFFIALKISGLAYSQKS